MKLSILTTITDPQERQDKYIQALHCYSDIADEVVIVNGGKPLPPEILLPIADKVKIIDLYWPSEWSWEELPRHLNAGLAHCTGDWTIKMDIDQFFHERDRAAIREHLSAARRFPIASFSKYTVYSPYKAFQKGQVPIAINMNFGNIGFGHATGEETDLCYPITKSYHMERLGSDYRMPVGLPVKGAYSTGITYFNYDYFFKTLDFSLIEFERFARAYERYFKRKPFGKETFMSLRESYKNKESYPLTIEDHPKYIREEVRRVIEYNIEVVGNI